MTLVGVATGCYALPKGKLELLMLSMKDCWTKRSTLIVYLLWSYVAYYWQNYEKASSHTKFEESTLDQIFTSDPDIMKITLGPPLRGNDHLTAFLKVRLFDDKEF